MKSSTILLATRRKLKPVPKLEILPPLVLLRRILRAHQLLPYEQRMLGDLYVKSEFKQHKSVDNPAQIIGFLSQWQKYLEAVLGDRWQHESLDVATIERMEPDKIVQLYELMVAAQQGKSEYNAIPEEQDMEGVDLNPDLARQNKK